jgi:transposase-like protein
MKCPRCKSESNVKNGVIKGIQRYKCKNCNFNYTVEFKSTAKSIDTRKFGLMLYLEGLGFQSIGRLLNVSHVAVIKWIRKYGEQIKELKTDKPAKIIELDEMHSYISSKKTIDGFGLLLIEKKDVSLISLLGTEAQQQVESSGQKLKTMDSNK